MDLFDPGACFAPRKRAKYQSSFSVFVVGKRKKECSGGWTFGGVSREVLLSLSGFESSKVLSVLFLERHIAFGLRNNSSSSS
jgi:hypothetical protein